MKKKVLAVLAAASLIVVQFAALPLTASAANIWIEDSSAPGGGYWMDEEGYAVDDGSEGSNYIIETYEEAASGSSLGNTSNDVEPVLSGGATTGTITAITAERPGIQQFQYTADGEVTFMFMTGGIEVKGVSYEASNGILTVNDGTTDYNVIMYSEANPYIASAHTIFAYNYSVTYDLDGTSVTAESGNINKADGTITHTAPLMYMRSGVEYELVGGANNQTQAISYDKMTSNYVFNYQVYNPQDRTLSISLNDERGNSIETITEPVKYKGGDVTVQIPQTLEKDGRKYQLRDTISSVTVNYFSTNLVYNYTYRELEAPNADPYSVKLLFLEEGTDKPLGEDFFTVSAEDIANGVIVTYSPSKERSLLEGDTRVYYTLTSDEVISHDAVNGYKTLSYNVYYKKQAEDAPYIWTIQLTDAAIGKILDTITKNVTVQESGVSYDVETQITVDGQTYILNSQMAKSYTHNYGDEPRTQVIYYDAEETYTDTDGSEYVKLAGQDNLTHKFESSQRTFTVYYRDVNDIQNADTVVIQELVTTTEETVTLPGADTTTPAGTEAAAPAVSEEAAPAATLTNETTGQVVTVDDKGESLADIADELTKSEDEEKNLSSMEEPSAPHRTVFIIALAVLIFLAAALGYVYTKKRKKADSVTDDNEE